MFLDEDDNRDLSWIGILTDSQVWYIWEFTATGPKYLTYWKRRRLDSTNIKQLERLFKRTVGKDWAPEDPAVLFKDSLISLQVLYKRRAGERDVKTQRELWFRQLQISGNQPAESHKDELFVLHTLLITVATKISEIYGNEAARYGFAGWVVDTDWLSGLNEIISKYNWRQETGDILRALYMGLVDKKDRHIYGEYYTPDWVAEMICDKVIDDNFISQWIEDYTSGKETLGGVMDPACGSGTFLYHAIRRVVESKPVDNASMGDRQLTDMIVEMICGVDIHPVAVAMTKATIHRALPTNPSKPLRIYQGDSLQVNPSVKYRMDVGETFNVVSRNNIEIGFPIEFIQHSEFDARMYRFANAARDGKPFPPGLDKDIQNKQVLHKAFETLTQICRDEGNGIWAWYMIQRVGIYRLNKTVSRFVANPPWVRMSNIQDKQRKDNVIELAQKLKLWVGGKNATGFNIASLFVVKCKELYGVKNAIRQGWVLPDAAMRGGNWQGYIDKVKITGAPNVVDLDDLAFPAHSKACVNYFGLRKQKSVRLVVKEDESKPAERENWDMAQKKLKTVLVTTYEKRGSSWFVGKRCIARQGAIITPQCLVLTQSQTVQGDDIMGKTKLSTKGEWKGLSFDFTVPKSWVKQVLFNKGGLLPYRLDTPKDAILPIDDRGRFLPERADIKWWRDASDQWKARRGIGKSTPTTLEGQIDFGGKLNNQFPIGKDIVVYNTSGSNLYAARLTTKLIIDSSLYRVPTDSKTEARFLCGIINADCMLERFQQARKSDRHFHTYFWREVPIPRYDKDNKHHVKLARLVSRAEKVVAQCDPKYNAIKQALKKDGVAGEIDNVVSEIMGIGQDKTS